MPVDYYSINKIKDFIKYNNIYFENKSSSGKPTVILRSASDYDKIVVPNNIRFKVN
jgi:hypothetical protein